MTIADFLFISSRKGKRREAPYKSYKKQVRDCESKRLREK